MVVWEANMGWELSVEMVDRGLCVMVWELYVARDGWQGLVCQGAVARGSLEWVGRPPCTAPLCILWLAACLFQSSQWCLLSLSGQSTNKEHIGQIWPWVDVTKGMTWGVTLFKVMKSSVGKRLAGHQIGAITAVVSPCEPRGRGGRRHRQAERRHSHLIWCLFNTNKQWWGTILPGWGWDWWMGSEKPVLLVAPCKE